MTETAAATDIVDGKQQSLFPWLFLTHCPQWCQILFSPNTSWIVISNVWNTVWYRLLMYYIMWLAVLFAYLKFCFLKCKYSMNFPIILCKSHANSRLKTVSNLFSMIYMILQKKLKNSWTNTLAKQFWMYLQ